MKPKVLKPYHIDKWAATEPKSEQVADGRKEVFLLCLGVRLCLGQLNSGLSDSCLGMK